MPADNDYVDKEESDYSDYWPESREYDHAREEHDWYSQYGEAEPAEDDFYTFDWDTLHGEPIHETHLEPMPEHHSSHRKHHDLREDHGLTAPETHSNRRTAARKSTKKAAKNSDLYEGNYRHEAVDEFPVYPYEASIFYDVANGYDIYYDPHYESDFDTSAYDEKYFGHDALEEDSYLAEKAHHYNRRDSRRSHRRNDLANETPMYVRPHLEDPVFLQPDDGEIEQLHHLAEESHEHEEAAPVDESANGFRKTGEKCNHDFECISGKCLSWLHKAPICMPF